MNTASRILRIRLLSQMKINKEKSEKLGLKDISKFKEKGKGERV